MRYGNSRVRPLVGGAELKPLHSQLLPSVTQRKKGQSPYLRETSSRILGGDAEGIFRPRCLRKKLFTQFSSRFYQKDPLICGSITFGLQFLEAIFDERSNLSKNLIRDLLDQNIG